MARVIANNEIKQKLFDLARTNYIVANKSVGANVPEPKMSKITLTQESTNIVLQNAHQRPRVVFHPEFFDYNATYGEEDKKRIWVSFANKRLGGGFLGRGYVQEEILTIEFYEMALMIVENNIPLMAKNNAYIFSNLIRSSISNKESYGHYDKAVLTYPDDIKVADFLAIDAPRRKAYEDPYILEELNHLCVKSLTGFVACKQLGYQIIHTGNWGAGVFHNRRDVVYFIQYLSAWLAGIEEIHFWGHTNKGVSDIMGMMNKKGNLETFFSGGMSILDVGEYGIKELYKI